jgi:hypothetical protein
MVLDRTFSSLTRVQDGSLQTQYRFKDGALACMSEMHFYQHLTFVIDYTYCTSNDL